MTKIKNHAQIKAQKDGLQTIDVIFNNLELPGGDLKFSFMDHNTPLKKYDFKDGQTYTVPISVMNHINQNTSYPVHSHKLDENQNYMVAVGKRVKRYFLEPVNMRGFYKPDTDIVTVEKLPRGSVQLSV